MIQSKSGQVREQVSAYFENVQSLDSVKHLQSWLNDWKQENMKQV